MTSDFTGYVAGDMGTILKTSTRGDLVPVPSIAAKDIPMIRVYPNPGNDLVTLSITPALKGNCIVEIFTTTGKKVLEKPMEGMTDESQRVMIDVSVLPNGFYIYRVSSEKGSLTGKFIKW